MRIALLQHRTPRTSTEETIRTLAQIIEKHCPNLLIGPEYLFVAPAREGWDWNKKESTYALHIFDKSEKRLLETELQKLTQESDTLLIPGTIVWAKDGKYQNSSPIFYQGRKIKEISKEFTNSSDQNNSPPGILHENYNTSLLTSPMTHLSYFGRHMFPFKEKNYLVEICDDHPSQARRRDINDAPPLLADIQIILSNSIQEHFKTPRSALFAREGGIVIECNGYYPTGFIARISGNKIETIYRSGQPAVNQVHLINTTL